MVSDVPLKVCPLSKLFQTKGTVKGPLLLVDIPDVALQIRRYTEAPRTECTLVGLLPRMSPDMPCKIRRTGEHFATILTMKPLSIP